MGGVLGSVGGTGWGEVWPGLRTKTQVVGVSQDRGERLRKDVLGDVG